MRLFLWLIMGSLIYLNYSHLFYLNIFTHSLPHGIYIRSSGVPKVGDYAVTCLTPEIAQYGIKRSYLATGNCDTGTVPVVKVIYGMPGDNFIIKNGLLEIHGIKYPILDHDSLGRSLKVFYKSNKIILGKDNYLLLSDYVTNSWDSRYWGPVTIKFLVKPFWIFDHA
ncbi:MAG: S26 family signal peptidase [Candidatus Omnitrophica bacterium]|nr:S26 family signal peptidase [Candidatus Omnitrophota bacterium]